MQYTKNRMSKLLIRLCSEVPTRFEDSRIFEITVRIGGFAALDICHANTHANLLNFQKTTYNLITSGQIDREAQ